jgi:hypothetical protein
VQHVDAQMQLFPLERLLLGLVGQTQLQRRDFVVHAAYARGIDALQPVQSAPVPPRQHAHHRHRI